MSLKNATELTNTRAKLARMEARYAKLQKQTGGDEVLRRATLRSMKRYINQFREEIVRYEISRRAEPARR